MSVKKALMIIVDGMGDRIVKRYNKTPLEIAEIPNMDRMAKEGLCGLMSPLGLGKRCGSDTAIMSILGYDPYKYYTGRGPLEAAGCGINIDDALCFRCNYASVDRNLVLLSRTADQFNAPKELEDEINKISLPVEFEFRNSLGYRCVLVLRNKNKILSDDISDIYAHEGERVGSIVPKKKFKAWMDLTYVASEDSNAVFTAKVLNDFLRKSNEVLNNHPINIERAVKGEIKANYILPRGGGFKPKMELFYDKYGLKAACISAIGLVKGIGVLTGMEVLKVENATGYIDTDLIAKARSAILALEKNDFCILHIEGTDEVSHDKDAEKKIKMLEKVDKMIAYLMENLKDTLIVVLADHTTSCDYGDHTADPAPFVMWNGDFVPDRVEKFCEREIYKGGLHRIEGKDVMPIILDQINKATKFGT